MHFSSELMGGIRIEAVAIDSSSGGFRACVYVRDLQSSTVLWFKEDLFSGRVFELAPEALSRALALGRHYVGSMSWAPNAPQHAGLPE